MSTRNYGLIRTAAELVTHARRCIQGDTVIGYDIESGYTGPDKEGVALLPHHPDWILVGWSFTNGKDWARYVPIAHDDGDNIDDVKAAARILWRMLHSKNAVPHNAQFELTGIARWFMETLGDDEKLGAEVMKAKGFFPIWSDSFIEAKMLSIYDPLRVGAGLKGLSKHILGQEMTEFKSLFPPEDTDMGPGTPKAKLKYIRFNTRRAASPRIIDYTCEDSTAAWELSAMHRPMIEESELNFMFQVEMKLLPLLVEMEYEALVLDWDEIHRRTIELAEFRDLMNEEIQQDFAKRTGNSKPILLSSPKQLSEVLFKPIEEGGLGLPIKKRSEKTEQPSTSDDALRVIAQKDKIIRDILTYRRVAKLYGSYLNKYDTELNYAGNGRAYPSHNQLGAGTGRMSVDGVSYQQWPKPYHFELKSGRAFDMNFRDLLISPPGFRIVGFDYSQIELRILAGQAGEDTMIQAFLDDIDIHKATAATMLRVPLETITKKQRGVGKTSNFAVVYQSGAENIADMLTAQGSPTTKEEAEQMLKDYYAAFPKLRAWMDMMIAHGSAQKYVNTPFGRKFTIWEYLSPLSFVRAKGDRLCINAPIQGGAADYMKIGLVRAANRIKKAEADGEIPVGGIRLVMSVHDALEFYVMDEVSTQTVIDLLDPMVAFDHPILGGVPIRADWHEGTRWGHVVEVKRAESGVITGYVNEDDDAVFDNPQDAYKRGEFLDEQRAEKYRKSIEERLAAEAAEQQHYHEDTGLADDYHTFTPWPEDVEDGPEFCAVCSAHQGSSLHNVAPADGGDAPSQPGPSQAPGNPGPPSKPVPDDVASELDDIIAGTTPVPEEPKAETPAAVAPRAKVSAKDQERIEANQASINHDHLKSEYYSRFHKEMTPGETASEWLARMGISEEEAIDSDRDAPAWAHTDGNEVLTAQEKANASAAAAPQEEVYTLTITEMPDADTYEVLMSWLGKMDGTEVYIPTRLILVTPEGELELGPRVLGMKLDVSMKKIERLVNGQFEKTIRNKIPEAA